MNHASRWSEEDLAKFVRRGRRAHEVLQKLPQDEKAWQATVDDIFTLYAWRHYHTRVSKKSDEGFPDSIGLRGVRMVVAELKINDELPTADQVLWLDAWESAGGECYVWYPEDVDYVHHVLGPVQVRQLERSSAVPRSLGEGGWRAELTRKKNLASDTIDAIVRKVRIGG